MNNRRNVTDGEFICLLRNVLGLDPRWDVFVHDAMPVAERARTHEERAGALPIYRASLLRSGTSYERMS